MKLKGKALLLLPLLLGGVSLSACKENYKGLTIKFWHTFGQTVQDGLKPKIAAFQKAVKEQEGVDLRIQMVYQGSYDDIAKKIADGYSVNNRPTIAVAYPDNVADYLEIGKSSNKEFVVNLEKYIKDDKVGFGKEEWLGDIVGKDETDFVEEFYQEGQNYAVQGTYSLPFMKSTEIMFYNMTLLQYFMPGFNPSVGNSETAIADYMSDISWEDFMDLCAYIEANRADVSDSLEVAAWYDSDANFFVSKLYQNNIGYSSVTSEGKGNIAFATDPERSKVVSLLETLNDQYKANLFTTKGIKNTYGSDFFTGEKCVFSIGSSGGSGYNFPQAEAFQLGVCRVPDSNNNPLYVSQGPTLAIFNDNGLSAEKNEQTTLYAWKFLKYITNGQANAELCVNGSEGYAPVRYSAYETEFFLEFMEEGEQYAKCYDVIVNEINVNAGYLVAPAFKGSAALRDECGSLLTAAIKANKADIPSLIDRCVSNARQKF